MSGKTLKQEQKDAPQETGEQTDMLTISDIDDVVKTLDDNHYGGSNANSLGLALKLRYEDIKDIEDAYPRNAKRRLKEVIILWLTNSTKENPATWQKLADAVKRDNKAAGEAIEQQKINKVDTT